MVLVKLLKGANVNIKHPNGREAERQLFDLLEITTKSISNHTPLKDGLYMWCSSGCKYVWIKHKMGLINNMETLILTLHHHFTSVLMLAGLDGLTKAGKLESCSRFQPDSIWFQCLDALPNANKECVECFLHDTSLETLGSCFFNLG